LLPAGLFWYGYLMLLEGDVAVIFDALEDRSPEVREAAKRVMALLRPSMRDADAREGCGSPAVPEFVARRLAGGEGESLCTPDQTQLAAEVADRYLQGDSIGVGFDEVEVFRYVEPEMATLLVTVSFHRCIERAVNDCDMRYAVGNDIGSMLAAFGSRFLPDIAALTEVYVEMHPYMAAPRAEWYQTRDDNVVFFAKTGHVAVGWQIAWTIGRAGLNNVIAELVPFLDANETESRVASLELLEDVIRFLPKPHYPQYGGLTAPETDPDVVTRSVAASVKPVEVGADYETVRVFFGTNRAATGPAFPWYGSGEGELALGACEVSLPRKREIGSLNDPPFYKRNWRLNPSRFVVVLNVQPRGTQEFCTEVKARVQSSQKKEALVFVHGYRVTFEEAARRTAQLAADLGIAASLFFSWPSRGKLFSYGADATIAERAVPRVVEFLDLLSEQSGAEVIHLIAHSMGTLALTKALGEYLQRAKARSRKKFREIILAAADIDAVTFKDQIVPKIAGKERRMTLYASRRDYALLCSKWLRVDLPRAGFIEKGKPLVIAGVETVDVSAVNSEQMWGLLQGHSYVGERPAVLQDIDALLKTGLSAGERFGNVQSMLDGMPYWIMRPRVA
jgi:esterase/lipase superfamily enzyme